jgi:hypothetical protein
VNETVDGPRLASICHIPADIVALASRRTTVEEVNRAFTEEADGERYRGVLGVSADPLVSAPRGER